MLKTNPDIRQAAKLAGLRLWQIADKLDLTDGNFSRKLRKELVPKDRAQILTIIKQLEGAE